MGIWRTALSFLAWWTVWRDASTNSKGCDMLLGTFPLNRGSVAEPTAVRVQRNGLTYLTLTYTRPKSTSDVTYSVQVSPDRGATWHGGCGAISIISTFSSGDAVTVKVQDGTAYNRRRLVRLMATTVHDGTVLADKTRASR